MRIHEGADDHRKRGDLHLVMLPSKLPSRGFFEGFGLVAAP